MAAFSRRIGPGGVAMHRLLEAGAGAPVSQKLSLFHLHDNSGFRRVTVVLGSATDFMEAKFPI